MINKISNISFKGYDVMPLRGFYMQGIRKRGEKNIFNEMTEIAKKEDLDLYVNQDESIEKELSTQEEYDEFLSVWGQDNKAFVVNKNGKTILWNSKESMIRPDGLGDLSDYQIDRKTNMPRGGNYYIGYKGNGDKWLIINGASIYTKEAFDRFKDNPTIEHIKELFDVKEENIYPITDFANDTDEVIRPIGYPNVLVNDYHLSLKNLEKMKKKFPECYQTYNVLKEYLEQRIREEQEDLSCVPNADRLCNILKEYGFNPIRIGGRYDYDINYMNALAFKNKKNGISYITNSTKDSYPELEYLEELFRKDLMKKVPEITDTYFVSGGRKEVKEAVPGLFDIIYQKGLKQKNVIMDILSSRGGGIHCMTAEIPNFDIVG